MNAPNELKDALVWLQREFPDARLTQVELSVRLGERHDGRPSESWCDAWWTVQVGNDKAGGDSPEEALSALRRDLVVKAQIPQHAERVAAILRELPEERFHRSGSDVLEAAMALLEKERLAARRTNPNGS